MKQCPSQEGELNITITKIEFMNHQMLALTLFLINPKVYINIPALEKAASCRLARPVNMYPRFLMFFILFRYILGSTFDTLPK